MPALHQPTANNVLNALMGVGTFTPSTLPIRCRLMTANGSGTANGTELLTGGGYTSGSGAPEVTFSQAAGGRVQSTSQVKIVNMPACTIVGVELWDSAGILGSAAVRKWYGALESPKQLNAGDTFTINIGALTAVLS